MKRLVPELFHMLERSNTFQKEQEVEAVKLNFLNWLPTYELGEFEVSMSIQQKCKSFGNNNNA